MDPVNPLHDPRINHCYANLNGIKYHYLLAKTPGEPIATIFLIHGWPDLAIGWRYQIPLLLQRGYRVVCPELIGFGSTSAPSSLSFYTYKRAATDIRSLALQLGSSQIILGGHDWGGAIAYRIALWYPNFVTHMFSICTPFWAPTSSFIPMEEVVEKKWPNFAYQIHLASGEVEERIRSKAQIRSFLNACYGGKGANGEVGFEVTGGTRFEDLGKLGKTALMSGEMLDFYAEEYAKNGMRGTLNWYRTRELNFRDELQLQRRTIEIPCLFIQATKDAALPPAMSEGMERYISKLTKRSVHTSHWALWEAPDLINSMIKDWLESCGKPKSSL